MIPETEIKQLARAYTVPTSTIERDYAQNWLLVYLPKMALKGGTGLKKCYFKDYRFSDDLDFTLLKHIEKEKLNSQIIDAIHKVKNESGIDFLEQVKLEEIDNGYRFNIHFRILRKTGDPLKIKIDITKKENENILIPVQQKKILQMYSDGFDVRTAVYSLDEMFAEKIRALFERTRPRDLYDIWFLSTHATLDTTLLKKKCAIRNVTVDVKELLARQSKFERAWESSLRHQLNNLPDATIVFTEVIEFVKKHTFKN